MKLLNKLITKTAIYKHLNDLYEQALKDVEVIEDKIQKLYEEQESVPMLKQQIKELAKCLETSTIYEQHIKSKVKKIRARVNKLDKKDENVKAIKQLIKEVL